MEEVFTPSSIFLLAAALFLVVISFTIVLALYSEKHRDRIAGFLLEGSTEAKGKPSLSRLQMLIWNIVVAFGFLFILANAPLGAPITVTENGEEIIISTLDSALAALFSPAILILLGVSNATYLLGKVAKSGAPESPPGDQSGDASKPDASAPAAPAPMG